MYMSSKPELSATAELDLSEEPEYVPGGSFEETPFLAKQISKATNGENASSGDDSSDLEEPEILSIDKPKSEPEEESDPKTYTRKYAHEDMTQPEFYKHVKHIFILSAAGKPIYTRYGHEASHGLVGLCALLTSICSNVSAYYKGDKLRCVTAGGTKFFFVQLGHLYLVAIAKNKESAHHLERCLTSLHSQILSIFTAGVNKIFETKPQYNLIDLFSRTDYKFMDTLATSMDNYHSFILNTVHCLRLNRAARNTIGNILQTHKEGDLFYSMILSGHKVVHLARPKKHILCPPDLHLIMNFVNASNSFRSSEEAWTPFCLPNFNSKGFMHLYVCYLDTNICLVLVFRKPDDMYIKGHQLKESIHGSLRTSGAIEAIRYSAENQSYYIEDVGIPRLRHFLYKSNATSQMTAPAVGAPYNTKEERFRIFRLYQNTKLKATIIPPKSHRVYFAVSDKETIVAWITRGFELYAIFGPLESKEFCITACNQLLKWIKQEENSLFILNSPVW